MTGLQKIWDTCKEKVWGSSEDFRIGVNAYKEIFLPGNSSNIQCKQALLEVFVPTANAVDRGIEQMIERAQEIHRPVVSEVNRDHLVVLGPQSSVSEGLEAYKNKFKDVESAFDSYTNTLTMPDAQPVPGRPKSAAPGY